MSSAGKATKARYVPFKTKNTELGWGIVHLYREGEESPELGASAGHLDEAEDEGWEAQYARFSHVWEVDEHRAWVREQERIERELERERIQRGASVFE